MAKIVATASVVVPVANLMTTSIVPIVTTKVIASRLDLFDDNAPIIKGMPVHSLDSIPHHLLVLEGQKFKAPRSHRLLIIDDLEFNNLAKLA